MEINRSVPITIGNAEHRLTFTAKASYEISKRYGGLDKLCGVLTSDNVEDSIIEMVWLVVLMANQSIMIDNMKIKGAKKPLLTEDEVALLPAFEVAVFAGAIMEAYLLGMRRDIESETEKIKKTLAGLQ